MIKIRITENDLKKMIFESVHRIITENIEDEGGNAITQAEPIRGDLAGKVAQDLIQQLTRKFKVRATTTGSTGKKGADKTSGDIDIILDMTWDRMPEVRKFIMQEYGQLEEFPNQALLTYSIGFPYDAGGIEKIVQVDLGFVGEDDEARSRVSTGFPDETPDSMFDWAERMRFSSANSKYKGAMRQILLKSIVKNTDFDHTNYPDEYYTGDEFNGKYKGTIDGQRKRWWRYTVGEKGLEMTHRDNVGKTKPLKNSNPIKADQTSISRNLNNSRAFILGPEATLNDTDSWESLVDYLFSGKYINFSPEMINKIFKTFFYAKELNKKDKMTKEPLPDVAALKQEMMEYVGSKMKENGIVPFWEENPDDLEDRD